MARTALTKSELDAYLTLSRLMPPPDALVIVKMVGRVMDPKVFAQRYKAELRGVATSA